MSKSAEAYYKDRAVAIGVDSVPPFLQGDPLQLIPNTTLRPNTRGLRYAQRAFESVEPFVIAGVPYSYEARGEELIQPAWQHIPGLKPARSYDGPFNFIRKHLRPTVENMWRLTYTRCTLEAITHDEATQPFIRRALRPSSCYAYAEASYELSQAYCVALLYDADDQAREGVLTVMQGVAHPDMLKKQFISARYFGAMLFREEASAFQEMSAA